MPRPSEDELIAMLSDEVAVEATDGCVVDPDGRCEHGHLSWLRRLGFI